MVREKFFVGEEYFRLGYKGENSEVKIPEEITLTVLSKSQKYINEIGTFQYYILFIDELKNELERVCKLSNNLREYLNDHKELTTLKIKTLVKDRKLKKQLLGMIDQVVVVRYDMVDINQNKTVFFFRKPKEKNTRRLPSLTQRVRDELEKLEKLLTSKASQENNQTQNIQNTDTDIKTDRVFIKYSEKYIYVYGKTYSIREKLKEAGFGWNPEKRYWYIKREKEDTVFNNEAFKEVEKIAEVV